MSTDSGPWGWWTLSAIFNPALVYPFDTPNLDPKGLHVGWNSLLWSWGNSWRGRSSGLTCRFRLGVQQTPGGDGWEMVVLEAKWGFFVGGWDGTWWEHNATPFKSPKRPSTSDPATTSLILPHPSVSSWCALSSNFHASSCNWLACCNDHNPWKKEERQTFKNRMQELRRKIQCQLQVGPA